MAPGAAADRAAGPGQPRAVGRVGLSGPAARGRDIPLGARIVSVCDAYEAMRTERTYREAIPHEQACQELRRCAARIRPAVVEAFLAVVEDGGDEGALDAAHTAAAHVRTLLDAGPAARDAA